MDRQVSRIGGVIGIGLGMALWQLIHFTSQSNKIPSLIDIAASLLDLTTSGRLLDALLPALQTLAVGYLLALLIGIPLGLLAGANERFELALRPYVSALFVLPLASLVPILILWLGTGDRVRIAGVLIFAVFPIIVNVTEGVRNTPNNLLEMARAFNVNWFSITRHIVIPHMLPFLIAGLRLGVGMAVRGLVVVEVVVSVTGFGELITAASYAFRFDEIIAIVVVLMMLGFVLTYPLLKLEIWLMPWKQSQQQVTFGS